MTWPDDVDPAALRQPDGLSCGAAVVVAARVLQDDEYRPGVPGTEILQVHRRLTSPSDALGQAQLPWPRALGTPPWAVARELAAITGEDVSVRVARWHPEASYAVLAERAAVRPTGVYVGSRWLPRHVVLAVDGNPERVTVFDPAQGRLVRVSHRRWHAHEVGVAGWSHLWAVV